MALAAAQLAVAQRDVDVVVQIEIGDQVEALEDEADLLVAQPRARAVVELLDLDAIELVLTAGQLLEQARDVEERRLAGAGWPGHRDELALLNLEREVAQRVSLDHLGTEHLGYVLHVKHQDS